MENAEIGIFLFGVIVGMAITVGLLLACGESNIDSGPDRERVHDECNMGYISVKCSNCNGSYIIEGSQGWLTKYRNTKGLRIDKLKRVKPCSLCSDIGKPCKCGEYHPKESMCPPHEVRMKFADNICPECGMLTHKDQCPFSDPEVDRISAEGLKRTGGPRICGNCEVEFSNCPATFLSGWALTEHTKLVKICKRYYELEKK